MASQEHQIQPTKSKPRPKLRQYNSMPTPYRNFHSPYQSQVKACPPPPLPSRTARHRLDLTPPPSRGSWPPRLDRSRHPSSAHTSPARPPYHQPPPDHSRTAARRPPPPPYFPHQPFSPNLKSPPSKSPSRQGTPPLTGPDSPPTPRPTSAAYPPTRLTSK